MKFTLGDRIRFSKIAFQMIGTMIKIYSKGGKLEKFRDGEWIHWYYRVYSNGKKSFVPRTIVNGLTEKELQECAPKGRKIKRSID